MLLQEAIAKLLRFESSKADPGQRVSLDDYASRMKAGERNIYFLSAPRSAQQGTGGVVQTLMGVLRGRGGGGGGVTGGDHFLGEGYFDFPKVLIISLGSFGLQPHVMEVSSQRQMFLNFVIPLLERNLIKHCVV